MMGEKFGLLLKILVLCLGESFYLARGQLQYIYIDINHVKVNSRNKLYFQFSWKIPECV